jgi:polyphosphate kinase
VPGLSERIRVRSILGRFLEHSRLYCFEVGDHKNYLMGSADLMSRNLDHRIEMVIPIEAPHVRAEIETIFRRLLSDNTQAWTLGSDGRWQRLEPDSGARRRAAQAVAMRGRARTRRQGPAR